MIGLHFLQKIAVGVLHLKLEVLLHFDDFTLRKFNRYRVGIERGLVNH